MKFLEHQIIDNPSDFSCFFRAIFVDAEGKHFYVRSNIPIGTRMTPEQAEAHARTLTPSEHKTKYLA